MSSDSVETGGDEERVKETSSKKMSEMTVSPQDKASVLANATGR